MSDEQRASTPVSETGSEPFELINAAEDETKKLEATVDSALAGLEPTAENKATVAAAADAVKAAAASFAATATAPAPASAPGSAAPAPSAPPAAASASSSSSSSSSTSTSTAASSKKSTKGATSVMVAPPETKAPFLSFINNTKSWVSPQVAKVIYYEKPCSSGIWIATLVILSLLSCSCCSGSLLRWSALASFFTLIALLVVSGGITLFLRFVKKQTDIPNPITTIVFPKIGNLCAKYETGTGKCPVGTCPVVPSKETVIAFVSSTIDRIPPIVDYAHKIFCVESYFETGKAAIALYFVSILAGLFSIKTMITIAVVALFTIPFGYAKYQTQIDAKVDPIVEKISVAVANVTAKLPFLNKKKQE